MQAVKRIEIISDAIELEKVIQALKAAGVKSYTVIRNVSSEGIRGTASDADITLSENDYVLAICSPDQLAPVVESLRPILNRFGGVCLISDALEIRSVHCVTAP
ncbi:MAG: P-II family nitrogen regulator [Elainella sp.]